MPMRSEEFPSRKFSSPVVAPQDADIASGATNRSIQARRESILDYRSVLVIETRCKLWCGY
jgi:hypothetical protein